MGKEVSTTVELVPDVIEKRWDTWLKNMEGKNKFHVINKRWDWIINTADNDRLGKGN